MEITLKNVVSQKAHPATRIRGSSLIPLEGSRIPYQGPVCIGQSNSCTRGFTPNLLMQSIAPNIAVSNIGVILLRRPKLTLSILVLFARR